MNFWAAGFFLPAINTTVFSNPRLFEGEGFASIPAKI